MNKTILASALAVLAGSSVPLLVAAADAIPANRAHGHEHRVISALRQPRQTAALDIEARKQQQTLKRLPKAACKNADFANASGDALITLIKAADIEDCLYDLYALTGTAAAGTFAESKMIAVANAMASGAASYPGDNTTQLLNLVVFLRAGYYVQYYHADAVGVYGSHLQTAIRRALDAFFAAPPAFTVSDDNGRVLSEVITLVDSATENARYANLLADFLASADNSMLASWYMRNAINSVFTVAFRGHQNEDFQALVQTDNAFFDALYQFQQNWRSLLGTDNAYLLLNAARESARFLRYEGAVKELARSRTKAMLDSAPASGATLPLWAALADLVAYFDGDNCSYYNTCNWESQLADSVLPVSHTCSASIKLRAQHMAAPELNDTCTKLTAQERYFHQRLETNQIPVPGDKNANLEVVVFNSSDDYESYAGTLFGIDTNNGGMYLEGNPDQDGNQARFIAYERTWRLPGESTLPFAIWNLEHEYVHYLDGRFIAKGGFSDSQRAKTVWWGEGLAQYIALKDQYPDALELAGASNPLALSTIFQNDYNSGSERVYTWGYLGVRFMFEKHMDDVRTIIGHFRNGAYTSDYTDFMNGLSNRYDSEFRSWLSSLASGGENGAPRVNAGVDQLVASAATVTLQASASDPDGDVLSYRWRQLSGPNVSLNAAGAARTTFAAPTVSVETVLEFELTVTDSKGLSASDRIRVSVQPASSGNAPVVSAGSDQDVSSASWVTLAGTANDADGDALTYAWRQLSGSAVTLETANAASSRFLAPTVSADTELQFELTVTDATGRSASDQIRVRVQAATTGSAPIVNAGADQSVVSADTVWLRGSASDADSSALSYRWRQTSGATVTLSHSEQAEASFSAPTVSTETVYEFALTVTDNTGLSAEDRIRITVKPAASADDDDDSSGGGATGLLMLALLACLGYRPRRQHR
ncbi:MAG: collagenase [Permianibacter sp.]